ncbi:alpha/beta hydrolase [Synechococcales cyanobacterium C]|uniref:Alpha/beta hydrolase n=1 Tax=Petrachloros mirabilis ULC683 TaxID=2781853 RepID=A0A8K1ZXE3_9CYAN|nr:alpha/beta hydrolase [Petrachloros mirabilis]NCJ05786.1 alpha/beta hydrolase [Petrachloros mirabilis ULC683]
MFKHARPWLVQLGWLTCLSPLMVGVLPEVTWAASRIHVSYSFLERSISVSALETFAKEGRITGDLVPYARYLNPDQLENLRQGLQEQIDLEPVTVAQFLYTPIGEQLLHRVGQVIRSRSGHGSFFALRASLILAAADPEGFTALSVLRHYPADGVQVDFSAGLALLNEVRQLIDETNQAVADIRSSSESEVAPMTALGYSLQQRGSFTWEKVTLELQDNSPQRLNYTGRARTYPADIYLPNLPNSSPQPVVVISHGLNSNRSTFLYLAEYLASHGFVVAVPEHIGSNTQQILGLLSGQTSDVIQPTEFVDRPQDVTFLLDTLEARSQSDPTFANRLDLENVGVIGQSFGGYTALALAGAPLNFEQLQQDCTEQLETTLNLSLLLQCQALRLPLQNYDLKDDRVQAIIAINPIGSSLFGVESYAQVEVPVLMVAGSADTVSPALLEQIQPFAWLSSSNRYLMMIEGGTHFSALEPPDPSAEGLPSFPELIGPAPHLARGYMEFFSAAFLKAFVAQQPEFENLLTSSYAASLSELVLPLRLTQFGASAQAESAVIAP